jgi:hypothetical protein
MATKQKRLILGIILIFLLFTLMLHYSLDHNNHDPDPQYILDNYEKFTTTKVRLNGEVKNVDQTNNTLLVQVTPSPEGIILVSTTENISTTQVDDVVEVYGVLTSRNTLTAEKLLSSERWKHDLIYIRSLPAIPFALYLFFRTWRFNPVTRRFERRHTHA